MSWCIYEGLLFAFPFVLRAYIRNNPPAGGSSKDGGKGDKEERRRKKAEAARKVARVGVCWHAICSA